MAIHTSIDEHLEEKSSSLFFYGKPFKDEASGSSLESDESQDDGPEINLNYSIENMPSSILDVRDLHKDFVDVRHLLDSYKY